MAPQRSIVLELNDEVVLELGEAYVEDLLDDIEIRHEGGNLVAHVTPTAWGSEDTGDYYGTGDEEDEIPYDEIERDEMPYTGLLLAVYPSGHPRLAELAREEDAACLSTETVDEVNYEVWAVNLLND